MAFKASESVGLPHAADVSTTLRRVLSVVLCSPALGAVHLSLEVTAPAARSAAAARVPIELFKTFAHASPLEVPESRSSDGALREAACVDLRLESLQLFQAASQN